MSGRSKLPVLAKEKKGKRQVKREISSTNSLPSLASTSLSSETGSIDSTVLQSKRNRLKSMKSHGSVGPVLVPAALNEDSGVYSDPGMMTGRWRKGGISKNKGERQPRAGDSVDAVKRMPTESTRHTPSPSQIQDGIGKLNFRKRGNSFGTGIQQFSKDGRRRNRNSESLSDFPSSKGSMEDQHCLGNVDTNRKSLPSMSELSGDSNTSPRWAGQLTHAVLELSEEITRLRSNPNKSNHEEVKKSRNKTKSTSLFWNQDALKNGPLQI